MALMLLWDKSHFTTHRHTHIHTHHRQPTHIGALSKPLPYVGQTVIPNSLFFKRAKTDKELW